MSVSIVASRYAKSLIELAKEQNVLEAVYQDMLLFKDTADKNRGLMLALKSPVVRHEKKMNILKALFEARVNKVSYAIFTIITKKNREAILDEIANEFVKAYNLFQGIQRATVATTTPLTDELRKQFTDIVTAATGRTVQLAEKIDPNLIGGYVLTIDDRQIDASLRSRLNELKLQFVN
ncbi:ATP synthase F1 subunit delta [Dyadobacter fanqingshengii]|uniref:ATP synthase subunit delta n=1 Tax=Dyadobacter fanqingshengii TaxID=2906443 RepID=A0A9X1P6Z7_9BACT|nr:ATP synthase F1 subunit delta [Dyadobacter fanqingshengii]MCF0039506.1 ATP synthase F1 subunit delta [Dyadobacter fanqingshengii]USJ33685.1 ATP synthase F1 subunit delta [Dyadobacter fanqingshengii]